MIDEWRAKIVLEYLLEGSLPTVDRFEKQVYNDFVVVTRPVVSRYIGIPYFQVILNFSATHLEWRGMHSSVEKNDKLAASSTAVES